MIFVLSNEPTHTWDQPDHVTLKDVARQAGVSESAASVVMNGARSGTRVSDVTRRRVLEIAENIGYRPNTLARALVTGRTNAIGVYSGRSVLDARNGFHAEVLGGIFEAAREFGTNTMIHTSGFGEHYLLDLLSSRALDGLIVHASGEDPILRLLGELRIPAVAIGDPLEGIPSILVDDRAGGSLQAKHLAVLGHKHVLLKQTPYGQGSALERMRAFTETGIQLGFKVTERLETFNEEDGLDYEDIKILTEGENRATAVVGWSDHVAERICNRLHALGLSIPADVAVVGFNGFGCPFVPRYELTTIHAPWSKVGARATELLMDLVNGKSTPMVTVLPVAFQRGNTT